MLAALADMTTAGALYDCDEERGLVAYEEQDQGANLGLALALVSHVFSTTSLKKNFFCRRCSASYLKKLEGFEKGLRGPTPAWRFWG